MPQRAGHLPQRDRHLPQKGWTLAPKGWTLAPKGWTLAPKGWKLGPKGGGHLRQRPGHDLGHLGPKDLLACILSQYYPRFAKLCCVASLFKETLHSGAIPIVRTTVSLPDGSLATVPLTPNEVATWVHQCLVDVFVTLRNICGEAAFDKHGLPTEPGLADIALLFGSHLGSVRDQAMIAWDYDADVGIFFRGSVRIASIADAETLGPTSSQGVYKAFESRMSLLGSSSR